MSEMGEGDSGDEFFLSEDAPKTTKKKVSPIREKLKYDYKFDSSSEDEQVEVPKPVQKPATTSKAKVEPEKPKESSGDMKPPPFVSSWWQNAPASNTEDTRTGNVSYSSNVSFNPGPGVAGGMTFGASPGLNPMGMGMNSMGMGFGPGPGMNPMGMGAGFAPGMTPNPMMNPMGMVMPPGMNPIGTGGPVPPMVPMGTGSGPVPPMAPIGTGSTPVPQITPMAPDGSPAQQVTPTAMGMNMGPSPAMNPMGMNPMGPPVGMAGGPGPVMNPMNAGYVPMGPQPQMNSMGMGGGPCPPQMGNMGMGGGPCPPQMNNMGMGGGPCPPQMNSMGMGAGPCPPQMNNMGMGGGPCPPQMNNMRMGGGPCPPQMNNMGMGGGFRGGPPRPMNCGPNSDDYYDCDPDMDMDNDHYCSGPNCCQQSECDDGDWDVDYDDGEDVGWRSGVQRQLSRVGLRGMARPRPFGVRPFGPRPMRPGSRHFGPRPPPPRPYGSRPPVFRNKTHYIVGKAKNERVKASAQANNTPQPGKEVDEAPLSRNAVISKPPQLRVPPCDNSSKTKTGSYSAREVKSSKKAEKTSVAEGSSENLKTTASSLNEVSSTCESEPSSSAHAIEGVTGFKNDGSFLEIFKRMKESSGDESQDERKESAISKKVAIKLPKPSMVGKRLGGRILKTGVVEKAKKKVFPDEKQPNDAWALYMAEVKKYREHNCEEEGKTRALVK